MQGATRIRGANRLTALEVKKANKPGMLEDGAGLRLNVSDNGQKHWVVRVTIAGKRVSRGLVHPTAPVQPVLVGGLSLSMLEFPFDTTRAIASLIFGGVIRDYPSIRWIFSHAGGTMPYLSGRLESVSRVNPALRQYLPDGLPKVLQSLYFDCALSANPVHFAALRELVDDTQILFGTDYPFGPTRQMMDTVNGLADLKLSTESVSSIESRNALRLFPRLEKLFSKS